MTKPMVQASSQTNSPEPYCWNSGPPVRRQESVLAQTRHGEIASKGVVLGGDVPDVMERAVCHSLRVSLRK